jgi:hypothetical protein
VPRSGTRRAGAVTLPVRADQHPRRLPRRVWLSMVVVVCLLLAAAGGAVAALYVDSVPTPEQLTLPESTTV